MADVSDNTRTVQMSKQLPRWTKAPEFQFGVQRQVALWRAGKPYEECIACVVKMCEVMERMSI